MKQAIVILSFILLSCQGQEIEVCECSITTVTEGIYPPVTEIEIVNDCILTDTVIVAKNQGLLNLTKTTTIECIGRRK